MAATKNEDPFASRERPSSGPLHSAEGLYAYAGQYLGAAEKLAESGPAVGIPTLSCLAQCVELLLKAYLLASGIPEKKLSRTPYGHDLVTCLEEAQELTLHLKLSETEMVAFKRLSKLHLAKELHYLFEYTKTLPEYDTLLSVTRRLQSEVFQRTAYR